MTVREVLRRRSPDFAWTCYREAATWWSVATSGNRRFLRFAPPGHFYSPIPDLGLVRADRRIFDGSVDSVPGVDLNTEAQLDLLDRFAEVYPELPFPERPNPESRFHLDNNWFSYGDAVALYSMMRTFRPRRIVEVGSGFSSAAMLDVNDRFFDGEIELTFVEPYPERLRRLLRGADALRRTIVTSPVQDAPGACFADLRADDILFIDSSHVAKTGSDVLHLLFRVLPELEPGVIVHVHDVLWPFEYPEVWLDCGRAWNEAYFMRAFLQNNDSFDILFFNSYLEAKHRAALEATVPLMLGRPSTATTFGNSSLWLRKKDRRTP